MSRQPRSILSIIIAFASFFLAVNARAAGAPVPNDPLPAAFFKSCHEARHLQEKIGGESRRDGEGPAQAESAN